MTNRLADTILTGPEQDRLHEEAERLRGELLRVLTRLAEGAHLSANEVRLWYAVRRME